MPYLIQSCKGTLGDYLRLVKEVRGEWINPDADCIGDEGPPWFRGQGDSSWGLVPRIYRREFSNADEKELRHEFQSAGIQLVGSAVLRTKWDWYFLMQHYGAPTRLLDWTINPLVALFFSLEDHIEEKRTSDAAVWAIDPWWLNKRQFSGCDGPLLPDWGEANGLLPDLDRAFAGAKVWHQLPVAIEPPHLDERLSAQGSRFVVFGKTKDLTRSALARGTRSYRRRGAIRLSKIVIPAGKTKRLLRELDQLNINRAVLFPDLGGLAAHMCYRWSRP